MINTDLKILCVDDEPSVLEIFQPAIVECGFTPIMLTSPAEAIKRFKEELHDVALVLSDFKMGGMSGFDFRRAILPDAYAVPFIIVSSYVTREMALDAVDLKIDAFTEKPIDKIELCQVIKKHVAARVDAIRESQALEGIFLDEARSILEELEPVLLSLDSDRSNQNSLNLVYRYAHTIKGSSGVLKTDVITRYVHRLEDIISSVKDGKKSFSDQVFEVVLKGFDRVKELIGMVRSRDIAKVDLSKILPELEVSNAGGAANKMEPGRAGEPLNDPAKAQNNQKIKDSIAVPLAMLDELSSYSGEITVIRNMVNKIIKTLEVRYAGIKEVQSLGELLDEMYKINSSIQVRITDLRKVPLSTVLRPIPRIVRDLGRDLQKALKLEIEGDSLRIDNSLATVCSNSIVHLVRNSADHGVEPTKERESAGKVGGGLIKISCKEANEHVIVTVKDDGRGLDPSKIRSKALEKGLYTQDQLSKMSDESIFEIIFDAGFSTAAKVTDVSGRGVGMDMVRSSVQSVGGQISIESVRGAGTAFHMKLPIPKSVLIISSLLVESSGKLFAIPQDAITKVIRIEPGLYSEMVQSVASGRVLRIGDEIYPLIRLCEILSLECGKFEDKSIQPKVVEVIILQSEKLLYGLEVDGILDSEEIVVKSIQEFFNGKGVFGGATFMGDGNVGLIIDVKGIAAYAGISSTQEDVPKLAGQRKVEGTSDNSKPLRDYLLFKLDSRAVFGLPLEQVFRLEEIDKKQVQRSGGERVVVYRDSVMPMYSLANLLKLKRLDTEIPGNSNLKDRISTIVAKTKQGYLGLEVDVVVDIAATDNEINSEIRDRPGILGNTSIRDRNVTVLDLAQIFGTKWAI